MKENKLTVDYFKPVFEKKETEELLQALNNPEEWSKEGYEAIKFVLKERNVSFDEHREWGESNLSLVCPDCQTKGTVHTKSVTQEAGISGEKTAWAVLTGGLSVLATGLSREESLTQAHCTNCGSAWNY